MSSRKTIDWRWSLYPACVDERCRAVSGCVCCTRNVHSVKDAVEDDIQRTTVQQCIARKDIWKQLCQNYEWTKELLGVEGRVDNNGGYRVHTLLTKDERSAEALRI